MLTEPHSLLNRIDRGLTDREDGIMQTSPFEEARQDAELVQSLRETIDAHLQMHSHYSESQFQLIFNKIKTLTASMELSFERVHQRLDDSIEQRLEQMHKDVATAVANTHFVSAVCEDRCDKMATAADVADEEMRALAAECKGSLRQLNSKVYKLEADQVQNGLLITGRSVVAAEEMSQVRSTIAELSSQGQAEMGEGRSYAARIEELALENGTLRALENQLCDRVEGVVDAAGRAYTSPLRELASYVLCTLNSEASKVPSQNFAAAASLDELQANADLRVLSQNLATAAAALDTQANEDLRALSHNFTAAKTAVELGAKSLNTHPKFSAAAGALRISSLAASAGAEQVQLPETSASFRPQCLSQVPEIYSGLSTPSRPHHKLSAADIALRVSSLVSGVEQVQAPLVPPVHDNAISAWFSEIRNPPETERHPRRLTTWPQ